MIEMQNRYQPQEDVPFKAIAEEETIHQAKRPKKEQTQIRVKIGKDRGAGGAAQFSSNRRYIKEIDEDENSHSASYD